MKNLIIILFGLWIILTNGLKLYTPHAITIDAEHGIIKFTHKYGEKQLPLIMIARIEPDK